MPNSKVFIDPKNLKKHHTCPKCRSKINFSYTNKTPKNIQKREASSITKFYDNIVRTLGISFLILANLWLIIPMYFKIFGN